MEKNCRHEGHCKREDSKQKGCRKDVKAYLEITMEIKEENRQAAAKVYTDYRMPFLEQIPGALTKNLLVRDEDVQVLHGFDSIEHAKAYLDSELFKNDVAAGLSPLWENSPSIKIFQAAA